jgi:sugar/nucleoside kinase (ribokinase family)
VSYTIPNDQRKFDVSGLGNALVDALVRIDNDRLLEDMGLNRGHMHPVGHSDWEAARQSVEGFGIELHSGGSCANTIAALGLMGTTSIYCGQVGDDELGALYTQKMLDSCGQHALHRSADSATGKCLSIISGADAERTMVTDLGAAVQLPSLGDFEHIIAQSRILHLTGYLLLGDPMRARAMEAIAVAKAAGVPVSLDAADPFVVEAVGEVMWSAIADSDIIFLNAEEAATLCGSTPEAALETLADKVDTVVVKLGSRGSLISHKGKRYSAGIHRVDAIDTTGAGDAYAAGFLYGLLHDWDPAQSADLGSRVAAATVSQIGAVVRDRSQLITAITASRDQ